MMQQQRWQRKYMLDLKLNSAQERERGMRLFASSHYVDPHMRYIGGNIDTWSGHIKFPNPTVLSLSHCELLKLTLNKLYDELQH